LLVTRAKNLNALWVCVEAITWKQIAVNSNFPSFIRLKVQLPNVYEVNRGSFLAGGLRNPFVDGIQLAMDNPL
jgi:hypothetical protein